MGALFVKHISQPADRLIINYAKKHPTFKKYFILRPAQTFHSVEGKAKSYMSLTNFSTKVPKLNEAAAMELGASLMKEIIFYSVAGICITLAYSKYQAKQSEKEEKQEQLMNKLAGDIQTLQELNKNLAI